jgi:hypothetical protein
MEIHRLCYERTTVRCRKDQVRVFPRGTKGPCQLFLLRAQRFADPFAENDRPPARGTLGFHKPNASSALPLEGSTNTEAADFNVNVRPLKAHRLP